MIIFFLLYQKRRFVFKKIPLTINVDEDENFVNENGQMRKTKVYFVR